MKQEQPSNCNYSPIQMTRQKYKQTRMRINTSISFQQSSAIPNIQNPNKQFLILKNYYELQQQNQILKKAYKSLVDSHHELQTTKNQILNQQEVLNTQHAVISKSKIEIISQLNLYIQPDCINVNYVQSKQKYFACGITSQKGYCNKSSQLICNCSDYSVKNKSRNKNKANNSLILLNSVKKLFEKNKTLNKTLQGLQKQNEDSLQSSISLQNKFNQNLEVLKHLNSIKDSLQENITDLRQKKIDIATSFSMNKNLKNKRTKISNKQNVKCYQSFIISKQKIGNKQVQKQKYELTRQVHKQSKRHYHGKYGFQDQMFGEVLDFINDEESKLNNSQKQRVNQQSVLTAHNKNITDTANMNDFLFSHSNMKQDLKQELQINSLRQYLQELTAKRNYQQKLNTKLTKKQQKYKQTTQKMKTHIKKMKQNPMFMRFKQQNQINEKIKI